MVLSHLFTIGHEQPHTHTPSNLEYFTFVRKRTGWQHGAQSLRNFESLVGQVLLLTSLKQMNANIRISFSFGNPNDRRFDRLDFMLGPKRNGVFAFQEITRLKQIGISLDSDIDGRVG